MSELSYEQLASALGAARAGDRGPLAVMAEHPVHLLVWRGVDGRTIPITAELASATEDGPHNLVFSTEALARQAMHQMVAGLEPQGGALHTAVGTLAEASFGGIAPVLVDLYGPEAYRLNLELCRALAAAYLAAQDADAPGVPVRIVTPTDRAGELMLQLTGTTLGYDAVLAYLTDAPVVAATGTHVPDPLDATLPAIPVQWHTDGRYVWDTQLVTAVARHQMGVPGALLRHLTQQHAQLGAVHPQQLAAARRVALDPDHRPAPRRGLPD